MNLKTLLAALAGAVVNFLLGWLVYGFLLMDYFEANTTQYEGLMNEMPNLLLIFLGGLAYAYLLAFIFDRWAGYRNFGKGFLGGLIIGFLIGFSMHLYWQASMNLMNMQAAILDLVLGSVMTGIVGGVIGWVLGTGKKAADQP